MPRIDRADWTDIVFAPYPVGADRPQYSHLKYGGFQYATDSELLMAKLLTQLGISFTPNIRFEVPAPAKSKKKRTIMLFVPDFVFNRQAYIWTNHDGTEEIIHGIEVKATSKKKKRFPKWTREKVEALTNARGIHIKLLSNDEVQAFFVAGTLPLRPLNAP